MSGEDQRKYLQNVSRYITDTCNMIVKNFGNNPDKMFKLGNYTVPQVYFVLRGLPGFGAKKASMITRDFALSTGSWFLGIRERLKKDAGIDFHVSQKHLSEVPVDVQVVKVFGRIMGEFQRTPPRSDFMKYYPDIQHLSKLVFPEFPSKLDEILWAAGREYCDNMLPKCNECPLIKLPCDYAASK
jgi:endonuclease III